MRTIPALPSSSLENFLKGRRISRVDGGFPMQKLVLMIST